MASKIARNRIRERRTAKNITLTDASFLLRISYTILSRWELQKFQPSEKHHPALEKFFGKDLFIYNTQADGQNT